MLREGLLDRVVKIFRLFRISRNQDPDEIYLTKQWPETFTSMLDNEDMIPEVQLATLKEQPQISRGTNINQFIEVHDTKTKMNEVIQEVKQQERQRTEAVNPAMLATYDDSSEEARIKNQ
jgi:hypothetical protein